jgi:hypothetical protein
MEAALGEARGERLSTLVGPSVPGDRDGNHAQAMAQLPAADVELVAVPSGRPRSRG